MFKKSLLGFAVALLVLAGVSVRPASATTSIYNQVDNYYFEAQGVTWDADGVEVTLPNQSYNWHAFGGGYIRTLAAGKPNATPHGLQMSAATTSSMYGAYQRVDLNQTVVQPVYFGVYVKGSNIALAPGSYFGASLYAEIHLKNGQTVYWNTPANSGTFDWKWIGFNTAQLGSLISAPIDHVFVVPSLIRASGVASYDHVVVKNTTATTATEAMMPDTAAPTPTPQPQVNGWQYISPYGWVYVQNGCFFYNGRRIHV